MVCKMLLSISYTFERVENQLFMAVLCKMYEMCVIKRCSVILLFGKSQTFERTQPPSATGRRVSWELRQMLTDRRVIGAVCESIFSV